MVLERSFGHAEEEVQCGSDRDAVSHDRSFSRYRRGVVSLRYVRDTGACSRVEQARRRRALIPSKNGTNRALDELGGGPIVG